MAEISKLQSVAVASFSKTASVSNDNISKIMGVDFPAGEVDGYIMPLSFAIEPTETTGEGLLPDYWSSTCSDDFDYGMHSTSSMYLYITWFTENLPTSKTIYYDNSISGDFDISFFLDGVSFYYEDPPYYKHVGFGVSTTAGNFDSGSYAFCGWALRNDDPYNKVMTMKTSAGTTDTSYDENEGLFRLVRDGSVITGYYSDSGYGDDWEEIDSFTVTSANVYLGMVAYYGGSSCGGTQYITVENINISEGTTTINENFTGTDDTLPTDWKIIDSDPINDISIQSNKLYVYSHNDSGETSTYLAEVAAPYLLVDDFDISVDCDSLSIDPAFPSSTTRSFVSFGVRELYDYGYDYGSIEIGSYGGSYDVSYNSDGTRATASGVTNTKLRLNRTDDVLTVYYWKDSSWTQLDSQNLSYIVSVYPYFEVWTRGASSDSATASCSFDNLISN